VTARAEDVVAVVGRLVAAAARHRGRSSYSWRGRVCGGVGRGGAGVTARYDGVD
jgi:hypothetical protein